MCFETFCTHVLIHCIPVLNLEYLFFITQLYYSCTDCGVLVSSYGMMTMCKQVSKVIGEFRICHKLLNSEVVCVGQRVKPTLTCGMEGGWARNPFPSAV